MDLIDPVREVVEVAAQGVQTVYVVEPVSVTEGGGSGGATTLDGLTDVTIITPLDRHALMRSATAGQWVNRALVPLDVGLSHVADLAPADLPVSTATQAAIDTKMTDHLAAPDPHTQYAETADLATVATSGAYGDLTGKPAIPAAYGDLTGLVPTAALPALAITDTFTVADQAAMLALTAQRGDVAIRPDLTAAFILAAEPATVLANWVRLPTPADAVLSVAGRTGVIVLGKADVGLDQVSNLSPTNLPLSDAAVTALAGKASTATTSALAADIATKADATATTNALATKADATTTTAALATKADATTTTAALAGKIANTLIDAKGDLIIGSGPDVPARLGVGVDGDVITADSAQPLGLKWAAPTGGGGGGTAVGGLKARVSTGRFVGVFGPCSNTGTWTVCPAAWRPPAITAAIGDVLDWRGSAVLGASNASGDAEFDLAAIDNTNPVAPVILRCLSSGTNAPLTNGDGGMYAWANNARLLRPVDDWTVQADDIVSGTVTLALLYRAGGSGLSVGHSTVYPSCMTVLNLGTPGDTEPTVYDQTAVRYGCKAITFDPHDLSWTTPQYIEMVNQRLYQHKVPLPVGTTVTGVRLPVQFQGVAGAGALRFAAYNENNTLLGATGDVAATFADGGIASTWVDVPFAVPGASTGAYIWIAALSTMDVGPKVAFCNTSGAADLPPWLLNLTVRRTEGLSALPVPLVPGSGIPYIDFLIGVY